MRNKISDFNKMTLFQTGNSQYIWEITPFGRIFSTVILDFFNINILVE